MEKENIFSETRSAFAQRRLLGEEKGVIFSEQINLFMGIVMREFC
jgi:hypothetical protein